MKSPLTVVLRRAHTAFFVCLVMCAAAARAEQKQPAGPEPPAAPPEFERGVSLYRQGDAKGAVKALRASLKKRKDDAVALYYLGLAQSTEGNLKDARKSFEAALKLRPDYGPARAARAYLLYVSERLSEAEAEAARALELDRGSIDAHYIMGRVKLRQEAWLKALEHADAILKLDRDAAPAYYLRSQAALGLSFKANAIINDERRGAYAYDPETLRQARVSQQRSLNESADNLETYLRLRPNDPEAPLLREQLEALRAHAGASGDADPARAILAASQTTTKARLLNKPEPGFTESARRAGITGTVRLRVVLGSDGRVRHVLVVRGLSHGLTERAVSAARKIRFVPATVNGQPVSQYVTLEYNFNIY